MHLAAASPPRRAVGTVRAILWCAEMAGALCTIEDGLSIAARVEEEMLQNFRESQPATARRGVVTSIRWTVHDGVRQPYDLCSSVLVV